MPFRFMLQACFLLPSSPASSSSDRLGNCSSGKLGDLGAFKWECLVGPEIGSHQVPQVPGLEHAGAWDCTRPCVVLLAGCGLSLFVSPSGLVWAQTSPGFGFGVLSVSWPQGVALQQRRAG